MGKGRVENDKKIEGISLEIANHWTTNNYLTETNKNCGTLVAFDADDGYLNGINTNIDLGVLESKNFKYDDFIDFLKRNNFTFVLGLRNISCSENNPSPEWTDKLKESLKSNGVEYDEYIVDSWPSPIPEFDVPDNIFMLRYSYDEYSKIDQMSAKFSLFEDFIKNSIWVQFYKTYIVGVESKRVIVLCSDIENLILHESFVR
jgi:hypothetical protein